MSSTDLEMSRVGLHLLQPVLLRGVAAEHQLEEEEEECCCCRELAARPPEPVCMLSGSWLSP